MRSEKAFAVTNTGDIKMSGKFLARASALSLAVFLAACGGDDSSTPLVTTPDTVPQTPGDTVQDGSGDQGDVDDGDDSGTGTGSTTVFQIGTQTDDAFSRGEISANTNTLTIGAEQFGSATLTLNIVDSSQGNALAKFPKIASNSDPSAQIQTGPLSSLHK